MYIKTNHLQKSERLGNLAMVDRMFDVEIGKEPFPKLIKVLRDRKNVINKENNGNSLNKEKIAVLIYNVKFPIWQKRHISRFTAER